MRLGVVSLHLYMKPLSLETFRRRLNQWGQTRVPFFFVIDFLGEAPLAERLEDLDPSEIRFDFRGFSTPPPLSPTPLPDFYIEATPPSFEEYLPRFRHVHDALRRGDSFLVNLSQPTRIHTNLDLLTIYEHSQAPYRLWLRDQLVCFSPESFVTIVHGQIASFPMKGTIDASLPEAAARILSDPKEAAEHATIVDLIRNDLSRVSDKVWVARYRYLDRLITSSKTLLQVSSEIRGQLAPHYQQHLGDLLLDLLPAGSISGAPKPRTLQIIQEAEGYERGYYTGIMGYFDGARLDSAVMIRYIEQQADGLVFKSGGGITFRSDARAEYQELMDKVYLPFAHVPQPLL